MENKKTTTNPLINKASARGSIMTKTQPTVKPPASSVKPTAPVAKVSDAAAKTEAGPASDKPTSNSIQSTPVSPTNSKKDSKKNGNGKGKGKIVLFGICVAVVIIAIIAIIIATTRGGDGSDSPDEQAGGSPTIAEVTEDEQKKTKETLDKYAEVTVDGYKQEEGHEISEHIVKVHVKNVSEEQTSLHIVIVANDKDGNALDISHLYAEGIRPGETQEFDTFVYTTMTPEQMKTATYKVYTADTYEVNIPTEEPAAEETPAE